MDLDMLDTGHRVLVLHPLDSAQEQTERAMWSWLPGTVLGRLGAGEWLVAVECRSLAVTDPVTGLTVYPPCTRSGHEVRPIPETEWQREFGRWPAPGETNYRPGVVL